MLASISLSVKRPVKVVSCSVVKVRASVSIYMLQITAAQSAVGSEPVQCGDWRLERRRPSNYAVPAVY